jgi:hypothetical protein
MPIELRKDRRPQNRKEDRLDPMGLNHDLRDQISKAEESG